MTPRAWGDVPQYNRVPGGNPPPRPDQLLQPTSRAGVGPAPSGATVIARRVIVFGPGEGIFIYSGSPGLGDLIGSWAGVAGVDQFGNSYPAGLDVAEGNLEVTQIIAAALTLNPGPFLLYGNPNTVQVLLTGAGNWPAPAGVTSVFAETIGSGSAGANGIVGAGGGGGTGGEYAAEPALAVTPGNNYAFTQGTAGGNTTFAGDSVTVTAHGGTAGGTGSTNTTHFNGGAHGSGGAGGGGGGGGSSGGFTSAGNAGHNESGTTGGAGGAAPTGGGAGGAGGNASSTGTAGTAPGGAGGGGGKGGSFAGGAGAAGWIRLTYTASGSPVLFASIAASAGTDPNTGDAYTSGTTLANQSAPGTPTAGPAAYGGSGQLKYVGTDGLAYNTGRQTLIAAGQNITSTTPATITGLSAAVAAASYRLHVVLSGLQGGGAFPVVTAVTGPAASAVLGFTVMVVEGAAVTDNVKHHNTLPSTFTGPAFGAGAQFMVTMDLYLTFSAAGTLAVTAAQGSAGHNWSVDANSFLDLMPVT